MGKIFTGFSISLFLFAFDSRAETSNWLEVGADSQAVYLLDLNSINGSFPTVSFLKKGVYSKFITETLGESRRVFKQTLGLIEVDCELRVNRVVEIQMLDENDTQVWSSGYMKSRPWERVLGNTHAEKTLDFVCENFQ